MTMTDAQVQEALAEELRMLTEDDSSSGGGSGGGHNNEDAIPFPVTLKIKADHSKVTKRIRILGSTIQSGYGAGLPFYKISTHKTTNSFPYTSLICGHGPKGASNWPDEPCEWCDKRERALWAEFEKCTQGVRVIPDSKTIKALSDGMTLNNVYLSIQQLREADALRSRAGMLKKKDTRLFYVLDAEDLFWTKYDDKVISGKVKEGRIKIHLWKVSQADLTTQILNKINTFGVNSITDPLSGCWWLVTRHPTKDIKKTKYDALLETDHAGNVLHSPIFALPNGEPDIERIQELMHKSIIPMNRLLFETRPTSVHEARLILDENKSAWDAYVQCREQELIPDWFAEENGNSQHQGGNENRQGQSQSSGSTNTQTSHRPSGNTNQQVVEQGRYQGSLVVDAEVVPKQERSLPTPHSAPATTHDPVFDHWVSKAQSTGVARSWQDSGQAAGFSVEEIQESGLDQCYSIQPSHKDNVCLECPMSVDCATMFHGDTGRWSKDQPVPTIPPPSEPARRGLPGRTSAPSGAPGGQHQSPTPTAPSNNPYASNSAAPGGAANSGVDELKARLQNAAGGRR